MPCHAEGSERRMCANVKINVQTFIAIRSISTKLFKNITFTLWSKPADAYSNMRSQKPELCASGNISGHPWAIFPHHVHAATWPTYYTELLQPLRVHTVQRGKLSHGTPDAHFPSALSLLHPASIPPILPPPSPGQKDYFSFSSS